MTADALTFIEHTALTRRSVHFAVGAFALCAFPARLPSGETYVAYTAKEQDERPRRIPRTLALELVQEPLG